MFFFSQSLLMRMILPISLDLACLWNSPFTWNPSLMTLREFLNNQVLANKNSGLMRVRFVIFDEKKSNLNSSTKLDQSVVLRLTRRSSSSKLFQWDGKYSNLGEDQIAYTFSLRTWSIDSINWLYIVRSARKRGIFLLYKNIKMLL